MDRNFSGGSVIENRIWLKVREAVTDGDPEPLVTDITIGLFDLG
jgi:hypothetical protein